MVQTKKVISMTCSSSTSSWKPWRWARLDLMLSMRDIYINSNLKSLTKFTSSSRSTRFKDVPWNISQMSMKTVPISMRIVISYVMKQGILFNGNWDNNIIRIYQWREIYCRTNTSIRRKKSKRTGLWESQSGILVGNLTIWVRSFEIEKL